jgi:polysaccharide biosynthesis transport protein
MNDKAVKAPIERLSDLGRIMRRRWLLIVALTCLTTAAAVIASNRATPEYEATAKLLLGQSQAIDALITGQALPQSGDSEREINTHLQLITTDRVARAVKRELELPDTVGSLTRKTQAAIEGNSNVVLLSARDRDPRRAAAIANAFATQYTVFEQRSAQANLVQLADLVRRKVASLSRQERRSPEGRQLRARLRELEIASALQTGGVRIVARAAVPTSAVSPRPARAGAIAGVLGLLLAVVAAVALHFADQRLRDQQEAEALFDVPVIAAVPTPKRRRDARRPGDDAGQYEAYTTLATNLRFFDVGRMNDAIMITSPGSQEGKTTVALGLARALAMLDQRVIAIEADFRRPAFSTMLALHPPEPPRSAEEARRLTSEWLEINAQTLRPVFGAEADEVPTFAVVPGVAAANPQALLSSQAMFDLVTMAKESADVVLIDVAPIGLVNDAIALSRLVDGAVLVARLNRTRRADALNALDRLGSVTTSLLGVVFTGAPRSNSVAPHDALWRAVPSERARVRSRIVPRP